MLKSLILLQTQSGRRSCRLHDIANCLNDQLRLISVNELSAFFRDEEFAVGSNVE